METVAEYIQSFEAKTAEYLQQIREIVHAVHPETEELINYKIAAFTLKPGAKRDGQVRMAGYAKHVGFYPQPQTIAHFSEALKDYKSAKGSVQFPLNKELPKDLIREMVLYLKQEIERG